MSGRNYYKYVPQFGDSNRDEM